MHIFALLVVAAPRVVVLSVDAGPAAAHHNAVVAGVRAAGLEVVDAAVTTEIERAVRCPRQQEDCLLRMSALGDVDGAIVWTKKQASIESIEIIVASVEHKSSARGVVDGSPNAVASESERLARTVFQLPAAEAAPPPAPAPVPSPPPTPPVVDAVDAPGGAEQGAVDVLALSLAIGGGALAVVCTAGAVVLDAGLSADIDRAEKQIAPRPEDFAARQALFFVAATSAVGGVVVAAVGGVMLATASE